jgi:hypothetical protein
MWQTRLFTKVPDPTISFAYRVASVVFTMYRSVVGGWGVVVVGGDVVGGFFLSFGGVDGFGFGSASVVGGVVSEGTGIGAVVSVVVGGTVVVVVGSDVDLVVVRLVGAVSLATVSVPVQAVTNRSTAMPTVTA